MEQELISPVWQIHGLVGRVTPGLLTFKNNRVIFITEEGIQFNEDISALTAIKWPALRMGLGFDTVVREKKYQFSFTKPNPSAPELDDTLTDRLLRVTDLGRLWDSIKTLRNVKSDKLTTKAWKVILKKNEY